MKALPLYTFLLGILISYFVFFNKPTKEQQIIFKQIDTIFLDREKYIHDTVEVKTKIVINHYDTVVKTIDSVFSQEKDSLKIVMFNIAYTPYDTFKLMEITEGQAKSAIEMKSLWIRDSSLLDICQDNVKNCDGSLKKIKDKIDTLKIIKPESYFFRDVGIGFGSAIVIFFSTYIITRGF